MKKVFAIGGGAGRVLCALPALQKYLKINGNDFYILCEGGIDWFAGNKDLQNISYGLDGRDVFENIIKPNIVITPEPYREHGYYNQKRSLTESFDFLINGTTDHSDLERPKIFLTKQEEIHALDAVANAAKAMKKQKTIVIQPFGRSIQSVPTNELIDPLSRSLTKSVYLKIIQSLAKDYNLIFFGENNDVDDITFKIQAPLRAWAGIIEASDYFVGCDSVGQHMAYAFNKPGTVILGSTFAENISYSKHFQILQKTPVDIKYFPIRFAENGMDGDLANRYNDSCMDFTDKEVKDIIEKIRVDIKKKT
jgi:ADP-heptose:LPS heptosyltransferase